MTPILLQPGINNSGPEHWQSIWEWKHEHVTRIRQDDWDSPVCNSWVNRIEETVQKCSEPPVVVAHSLGCLALAKWAAQTNLPVQGLMFVALPDAGGPNFPKEAIGFDGLPLTLGGARSLVVYSDDDPFWHPVLTRNAAQAWRSDSIGVGSKGHINSSSGLGDWPLGWQLVQNLVEG